MHDGTERDRDILRALERGDRDEALGLALRTYRAELYGFLTALTRDEGDAADLFAVVSEKLWRGLDRFEGRSSFRTWMYRVARNAVIDHMRRLRAGPARTTAGRLATIAAPSPRTTTRPHQRTTMKEWLRQVRDSLPVEAQTLLILRIDRGMSWRDIALVMSDAPTADQQRREASRFRKRFERIKRQLRRLLYERQASDLDSAG